MSIRDSINDSDIVWSDRPQMDSFDSYLRGMVEIHQAMFKKLIGDQGDERAKHLAALFEDVANRYLDISDYLAGLGSNKPAKG